MKKIFAKAILFIRENPSVIYSFILLVLIPAAFFLNTYLSNSSYEENIDLITQRKVVLLESVINSLVQNQIADDNFLQTSIEKIKQQNEEVISISILRPASDGGFLVAAASDRALIGQRQDGQIQNLLAFNKPEGIAFLDRNEQGRFWNVTKLLADETNKKIGLISMSLSLRDSDDLVTRTITNSYWILILTILVVILLVSNQARLFGYALTLTKLKEIDQMKDMFISMASHELRSPLTSIIGYIDLIKTGKDFVAESQNGLYLEKVSVSADRLRNLIGDILEVSRMEGNRLPIELTVFDPSAVIAQSVDEMREQARQKGLAFELKAQLDKVKIKADVDRLKQILINLISNAIKYTEKGSVEVNAMVKNKDFLITVADTGMGISVEDQARLFQKFYRIKNEKTQNIIGTGLGLWITLEIAKRMGGKVTVQSIEGVGSHFTVYLPIAEK